MQTVWDWSMEIDRQKDSRTAAKAMKKIMSYTAEGK